MFIAPTRRSAPLATNGGTTRADSGVQARGSLKQTAPEGKRPTQQSLKLEGQGVVTRLARGNAAPVARNEHGASDSEKPSPLIQTANYAANMLRRSGVVAYVINMLIIGESFSYALETCGVITFITLDERVWVRWYDREGAIQSSEINFISDLPSIVPLVALFIIFSFWVLNNAATRILSQVGFEGIGLKLSDKPPVVE